MLPTTLVSSTISTTSTTLTSSAMPTTPLTINALLNQMKLFLQDCPKLIWEWSLSGRAGEISDRDRVTCWVVADEVGLETFTGIHQLLEAINAPVDVLQQQQTMALLSIRQGVSVALSNNGIERRLYLHTRQPRVGIDQYQSYRWTHVDDLSGRHLSLSFFPRDTGGRGSCRFGSSRLQVCNAGVEPARTPAANVWFLAPLPRRSDFTGGSYLSLASKIGGICTNAPDSFCGIGNQFRLDQHIPRSLNSAYCDFWAGKGPRVHCLLFCPHGW